MIDLFQTAIDSSSAPLYPSTHIPLAMRTLVNLSKMTLTHCRKGPKPSHLSTTDSVMLNIAFVLKIVREGEKGPSGMLALLQATVNYWNAFHLSA